MGSPLLRAVGGLSGQHWEQWCPAVTGPPEAGLTAWLRQRQEGRCPGAALCINKGGLGPAPPPSSPGADPKQTPETPPWPFSHVLGVWAGVPPGQLALELFSFSSANIVWGHPGTNVGGLVPPWEQHCDGEAAGCCG